MTDASDHRVRAAIDCIAQGGMVTLTDHEGRGDEGDLIAAALIPPQDVAVMVRHTTGILCEARDAAATAHTISCNAAARPGHPEAAHDLAALAGLRTVGVLSKRVNDDGTMMRGSRLAAFATARSLLRISLDALSAVRGADRSGRAA